MKKRESEIDYDGKVTEVETWALLADTETRAASRRDGRERSE